MTPDERLDMAIDAAADALLSVASLQTGENPMAAYHRAHRAILAVLDRGAEEARRRFEREAGG